MKEIASSSSGNQSEITPGELLDRPPEELVAIIMDLLTLMTIPDPGEIEIPQDVLAIRARHIVRNAYTQKRRSVDEKEGKQTHSRGYSRSRTDPYRPRV